MNTQSAHPPPGTWNARNLLTVPEVAEWARVHPKTVYRWIKDGKLEAIQLGPVLFVFRKTPSANSCVRLATANPMAIQERTGETSRERLINPTGAGLANGA